VLFKVKVKYGDKDLASNPSSPQIERCVPNAWVDLTAKLLRHVIITSVIMRFGVPPFCLQFPIGSDISQNNGACSGLAAIPQMWLVLPLLLPCSSNVDKHMLKYRFCRS
jgi:hypothetical protein